MHELPRTLKIATVWLVLGTALFLAVQAFLAAEDDRFGKGRVHLAVTDILGHWAQKMGWGRVELDVNTDHTTALRR